MQQQRVAAELAVQRVSAPSKTPLVQQCASSGAVAAVAAAAAAADILASQTVASRERRAGEGLSCCMVV